LNSKIFGITVFRALFFAPVLTSITAWVIVWKFILQNNGFINQVLAILEIHGPNWLENPIWAMVAAIVTLVIKNVGVNMIILLAALKGIPHELIEAAEVDGANSWNNFRHITLPLLSPALMLVTVLTVIGSLGVFDHILLLTAGGPGHATTVLAYYIYFQAFKTYEVGYASALAVILFLVAIGLTVLQWSLRKRLSYVEQ
jgi:multiple sugar transport system permease protein